PSGKRSEREFSKIKLVFNVAAFKNITRARYVLLSPVAPSIHCTPVALPVASAYCTESTMLSVKMLRFPVLSAHGMVLYLELKYAPNGHPRSHMDRAMQTARPCCF